MKTLTMKTSIILLLHMMLVNGECTYEKKKLADCYIANESSRGCYSEKQRVDDCLKKEFDSESTSNSKSCGGCFRAKANNIDVQAIKGSFPNCTDIEEIVCPALDFKSCRTKCDRLIHRQLADSFLIGLKHGLDIFSVNDSQSCEFSCSSSAVGWTKKSDYAIFIISVSIFVSMYL